MPNLVDTFFKCDPGLPSTTMRALSSVPFKNAIVEHNHGGQLKQYSDNVGIKLTNVAFNVRETVTDEST